MRVALLLVVLTVSVLAQTPPKGTPNTMGGASGVTVEPTYKLGPEASVEYQNIIKQQQALVDRINELENLRQHLMIGAGIPVAERDRQATLDADGKTVVFLPKKPTEAVRK